MDRPVRRRHSSILKPPRSPLQDLRGGNETVQDSNALRNKKSSRRVSFISITEHNHERKHANDQTVIFSEENQMDLTTSHTVMINKGLLDCTKSEKSTKIDTTSFLANLKLHTKDSRMKKELNFSMDQSTSSEKKINFNDFIKRLKTGKSNAFPTGPDKENFEISVHPKESNRASSVHQMHVSLKVDENSNNMTRIFREQDDGMNFTQCHTANIETLVPTSTEASLREFKGDDITIYGNDYMDLTTNYTIQNLPSADNLSNIENQTQNVMMEVMTDYGTEDPGRKTVFKNKPNAAFQDPSLNPNGEIHITKSHITGTETHIATQTSNQDASTLAIIPGSICSSSATQDYKTFFCSSSNDAMELTKCLSGMREVKNLLKNQSNYSKTYPNPDAISLLTEKTIYSGMDNMDITRSHTVVIDNQIFKEDHTNTQRTDTPISEKEMMLQNLISSSEDGEMNINCSSVPHVSKGRLQQSLANSLSISLTGKKTEIFTGEDMDLTKNHTANLGSQSPLVSCNLISENTGKFHSHSKSPSDEWKEMNKSHTEPSQQPDVISKNIPTDTWSKEKDQVLKTAPYLGKDSPQSADINQDIATSHRNLEKQIELGNNRNTVSCEASLFPTTEPLFSLEGQSTMKNHNIAVNSYTVKSVSGQNSKLPEPLRKSVGNPTPDCSHNKTIICSEEEQNMDLTKSHTIVIGFGPSELQELGKTNLENTNCQLTTVDRKIAVNVEKCNKSPTEKNGVFVSNDNIDVLEDQSIQKLGFQNENQDVKIYGRKSVGRQKVNKTIVFSEGDENDMDITKSYTVEINHKALLYEQDSHLTETSKSVLYTCGQDDMEVTKSHTTALECKTVSPDKITTRPIEKTVMFIDNYNELEMTKSHTVFIDYQAKERTVLTDRLDFELSKRNSLEKPKVSPASTEENVSFPENGKSEQSAAKVNELTLARGWSNNGPIEKAVGFIAGDHMEVSKSSFWENNEDVQKPEFLNETISGKSQRRKSLRLKNNKTAAFSKNDKNDMDITQSYTVEINKTALEDREDSHLVHLAGDSKTVLYTCGQDDMEMTRSHTTALECKTVSPVKITTRPIEKTVMFVDNHSDLDVTKSHTVFIDCQDTEKILQEYPKFGIANGKILGISFHNDGSSVQENIEKQALAVENKIVLYTKQKHHVIPSVPTNTLSGGQSELEIIKFKSTVGEEVMGSVVDQACTLEKAKIESCQLNSTDRRNMDFTNSHATAMCGSSDNYSHLQNAISCFDNLEGNAMSLGDKDEKTSNCPVQNDLTYVNNLANEYYLKSKGLPLSASCSLLEKEKVTGTNIKRQPDSVKTVLKDQDLIKEPPNLRANQTLLPSQDLGEITKPNSKRVSFKLPEDQMEGFVDIQLPPLPQQGQIIVNKDETISSHAGNKNLNIVIENSSVPTCENESKMLNNDKQSTIACKKEPKKNIQTAKCNTDFHSNSDLPKQVIQIHANSREALDPAIASNTASFSSVTSNLNNFNGKPEEFFNFQTPHVPPSPEQLLGLTNKAHNPMSIVQATEIHSINTMPSNVEDDRDEESKISPNGTETNSVPLTTVVKDKVRRCSLGIFLPRLPNKRNCSVTGINDLKQFQADTTELNHLEAQPVFSKESSIEFGAAKLTLSPSQYINEENLPIYPGEINSSDSITIETEENKNYT
uniref:Kinetochore scaffold 1 n=1 Tax=Neovison vison TaxID=452646 RepID=A0A8C7BEK3_NEOVI